MWSSDVTSFVGGLRSSLQKQRTLNADEVASLYREPGVLTGYRLPGQKILYYVISVFQLNNETVNVWTHFIGFLVILYKLFCVLQEFGAYDPRVTPLLGFCACGLMYTSLSVIAHTIHSASPRVHYTCFHADYAGIGLYGFASVLPIFYISADYETKSWLNAWCLPINFFLSWLVCFCCCIAKLIYRRPYPFKRKLWQIIPLCLHLSFIAVCLYPRYANCGTSCDNPSLNNNKRAMILVILAGISFSSHLPEKIWPGWFDFFGQGHQVFHVVSVLINVAQFEAARWDILNSREDTITDFAPRLSTLALVILFYCFCCVITVAALRPGVIRRVEEDEIKERKCN